MNRRQYLMRTGIPLAALVATAGCLDDLPGSASSGDSVAVADRTGDRELDRAVGELNEAALALFAADDFEEPTDVEFDPAEPTERIESARTHLETAAAELDEDRESEIELLRTYAAVLERLVDVTETVTDETLEADLQTVFEAVGDGDDESEADDDDDLEAASETIDERTDEFAVAETNHAEAAAAVESFDEAFERLVRIDPAELEDGIAALGDAVASLVTLGDGLESLLGGYEGLQTGREHMENREYGKAETAFGTAESTLGTATTTFEEDEDPPGGIADHVETATCQSEHLADAAGSFEEWAIAASNGDPVSAQNHKEAGERSVEAAGDCT
ncbi:hypothetical protein HTZ84_16045 [Haloterrigena sp. SYSU A558-1]|uniref:DUF5667 domain-containing protein n=1 Tax=Haloterrigena gelatinilytica TaxID=2741724 RepID=A0ABX2LFX7_9EURY|nr:hypothetical protein [Haloterrigena gelatinilytica]NUC73793.1 hypothetical protein [Haloterrigena gelatinilytica]